MPPYLIFILLQIILLKGKFPPFQLLQIAASYLTSAFITIFDGILPSPDQLGMRLALLVLAIILTGIGAAITVDVNIVPNPADGLGESNSGKSAERTWDLERICLIFCDCDLYCYWYDRSRTYRGDRDRNGCGYDMYGESDCGV